MRSLIAIFIACALVSTTVPSNAAGKPVWTENGPAAKWVESTARAGASKAWVGATTAWAGATTAVAGAATFVVGAWQRVTKSAPDKPGSEPVQNTKTTLPD